MFLKYFIRLNRFNLLKLILTRNSFYSNQLKYQFKSNFIEYTFPSLSFLRHSKISNPLYNFNDYYVRLSSRYFSSSKQKYNKKKETSESELFESAFSNESKRLYKHPGLGHHVLVIQPRIKHGPDFENKSTAELKLSEAVSLINTLIGWQVCEEHIISVTSLSSNLIFGKGNLDKMKSIIQNNPSISAVFVGVDVLKALQNTKLETYFKVQVFDRYQIILQIFNEHAHTKEAKLQLALAEIPYLRIKLASFSHTRDSSTFSGIHHVGGDGETFMEMRRRLLNEREMKLKKALGKIKNQRELLRQSESRNTFPIIAVVGYTNCGKTTLIKSLTNDSRLQPEDKLFATLDVTLHPGALPSNQKVLFIDTVGFISNVPTALIQSFRSTLEEITLADIVIHVRDISHPNAEAQKETVLKTLKELDLPEKLIDSIIEVRNKIDLINDPDLVKDPDAIYISATEGTGLTNLLESVEQNLFKNTGHDVCLLRVPNGGKEYSWLLKETAIRDAMADTHDANYLILEVVISPSSLAKFKHEFGDLTIQIEDLKSLLIFIFNK